MALGIKMIESLHDVLTEKDKKLRENNIRSRLATSSILKRSKQLRNRLLEQLKQDKEAMKLGKTYKSCSAIDHKSAKCIVLITIKKESDQNKYFKKEERTCKYYPVFCDKIGSAFASNKQCCMYSISKEEKQIASNNMKIVLIERYLQKKRDSKFESNFLFLS